jgi:hypothetical protein
MSPYLSRMMRSSGAGHTSDPPLARRKARSPRPRISKRSNQKITTDVQRIEVAASGDLACEFSYGTVDYDLAGPSSQHVAFRTGLLRVWKVNGDWRIAALFVRPLDAPFDLIRRLSEPSVYSRSDFRVYLTKSTGPSILTKKKLSGMLCLRNGYLFCSRFSATDE